VTGDPLQQLEREPARAYERLLAWAHLGPGRSLKKAAEVAGCSESTMRAHAREWSWADRVSAFDRQHLGEISLRAVEQSSEDHLAALASFKAGQLEQAERLSEAAGALLAAAMRTLASLKARNEDLPPQQVVAAMTAASRLMEVASDRAATVLGVEELLGALTGPGALED
jgi:hypothetical protein